MNTFIVETKAFGGLMKLASSFLPSRSVLPIIENFKIEVNNNVLHVSATNLEHGILLRGQCQSQGKFSFVCPPLLMGTIQNLSKQAVTIEVGDKLTVTAKEGKYEMALEPADDYPQQEVINSDVYNTLNTSHLRTVYEKVVFCASKDEDKPALSSILVSGKVVGVDGHRMAYMEIPFDSSVLVPSSTFRAISGLIKQDCDVDISSDAHHIQLEFPNVTVWSRKAEDKFPAWDSIIPEYRKKIEVDRDTLLSTISRSILYVSQGTKLMQSVMTISEDKMIIETEDPDFAVKSSESISIKNDSGLSVRKGFNIKNLQEIVNSCTKVEIWMDDQANRPFVIKGGVVNYLLMPIDLG